MKHEIAIHSDTGVNSSSPNIVPWFGANDVLYETRTQLGVAGLNLGGDQPVGDGGKQW
jgi:hypothetical protein